MERATCLRLSFSQCIQGGIDGGLSALRGAVCILGQNDRVNSAQSLQILRTNELFADKPDRDLLFLDQAISRQYNRANKHPAQKEELRACAQILEHGPV